MHAGGPSPAARWGDTGQGPVKHMTKHWVTIRHGHSGETVTAARHLKCGPKIGARLGRLCALGHTTAFPMWLSA